MALLAKEELISQLPLFIDYGQLGKERELAACRNNFRRHKLPNPRVASIAGYGTLLSSRLTDAKTLHAALRNAMRQAPDVLFIGEIRDRETMGAALAYSMSGHLVVATMHATNSAHALNRVISFYSPETRQALFQDMAASMKAIISQRLVRSKKGGRVPTVEVLMNSGHMSDLIERGDVQSIKEAMEQSLAPESQTFEQSLYTLLQRDAVTREDALGSADSKNNLLWLINNAGKPATASAQGRKDNPAAPASSFSEFTLNI